MTIKQNYLKKDTDSDGRKTQITVRLPRNQLEKVENLKQESGISRAEACRRLISKGLQERRRF